MFPKQSTNSLAPADDFGTWRVPVVETNRTILPAAAAAHLKTKNTSSLGVAPADADAGVGPRLGQLWANPTPTAMTNLSRRWLFGSHSLVRSLFSFHQQVLPAVG